MKSKLPKRMAALLCVLCMLMCSFALSLPASAVTIERGPGVAKQVSDEGIVLLKNEGDVLPLAPGTEIAVFGGGQNNWQYQSAGAPTIASNYVINFMSALQASERLGMNAAVRAAYGTSSAEITLSGALVQQAAAESDIALITIARRSGENADHTATKGDYYLSDAEKAMVDAVTGAFDKVLVMLNIGTVMDTSWISDYSNIDGVLLVYFPGMEGGNSVVDVLTGAVNPSGRLVDTFPLDYTHIPSGYNFGLPNRTSGQNGSNHDFNFTTGTSATWEDIYYAEDIYVGYRYYETFGIPVAYPFGYGLSYTSFTQTVQNFAVSGGTVSFDVVVKNTGGKAGKDVVEVYYAAPAGSIEKPAKELVSYAKTGLLAPDASETVRISFAVSDMASYDEAGARYILESGVYNILIGASVRDTRVVGTYTLAADTVTETLSNQYGIPDDYTMDVLKQSDVADPAALQNAPETVADYFDKKSGNANLPPDLYGVTGLAERRIQDDNLYDTFDDDPVTAQPDPVLYKEAIRGNVSMADFVKQMTDSELANLLVGVGWGSGNAGDTTSALSRLGIPVFRTADGDAGVKGPNSLGANRNSTGFPCGTMMACTWNNELIEDIGRVIGEESTKGGVDILLAPAINIHRNPLCGRNPEYRSEDPLISGMNAAMFIKGLQSQGVGATIKHFAVNSQETVRKAANAIVSERALREIYFKGYEIAVKKSQPWAVMTSYNPVNGTFTANSYDLIHNILRGEWGFEGFVMTDFEGWDSQVKAEIVGNEWTTPGTAAERTLYQNAMASGELPRSIMRANAAKMLEVLAKTPKGVETGGYAITVNADSDATVVGVSPAYFVGAAANPSLRPAAAPGTDVQFSVTTRNNKEVYRVMARNADASYAEVLVPDTRGEYTFEMPNQNVIIQVDLMTARKFSVQSGDTVTVPITLAGCEKFAGLSGKIEYDQSLLTLQSITASKGFTVMQNGENFVVVSPDGAGLDGDVVVGYAVFTAKADLDDDALTMVNFPAQYLTAYDEALDDAYPVVPTLEITVLGEPPLCGDVNLDDKVDVADAILLMQHLAGSADLSVKQLKAADANRDGAVNVGDSVIIMQMCL